MKNREVFQLKRKLDNVRDLKGTKKFVYAVLKNIDIVESYTNRMLEKIKPSKAFEEYDLKRNKLAQKYSRKDENGKFKTIMVNGSSEYDIENKKEFNAALKELKEKNKKAIDDMDKRKKDFDKAYEEESTIKLHLIDESEVPDEITPNQLGALKEIIK